MADDYHILEELGSKSTTITHWAPEPITDIQSGGSFGVVYKGIEKATGLPVALKLVSDTVNNVLNKADSPADRPRRQR